MTEIENARAALEMAIEWISAPQSEQSYSADAMIAKLSLAVAALNDTGTVDEPVAYRYAYKFRDIGQTGAYEYLSREFAIVANMQVGEPLYTRPPSS